MSALPTVDMGAGYDREERKKEKEELRPRRKAAVLLPLTRLLSLQYTHQDPAWPHSLPGQALLRSITGGEVVCSEDVKDACEGRTFADSELTGKLEKGKVDQMPSFLLVTWRLKESISESIQKRTWAVWELTLLVAGSFRNDGLKASDVLPILKEKVAFVSGGRDKRGGPILTFPARSNHDRIRQEDLRKLVTYLASVPSEDVCKRGFTVIIDMRGSKWDLIKPLLKTLQEAFPAEIHVALIIKPDNFWQKQKTNFGSSKFIFETSMVSVEGLTKLVDPSQLTEEFDGSLDYNHEEWIELRLSLEEFFNSAVHLLSRLEDLQEMLARKEFPVDVEGSRRLIDEHTQLKKKVLKAPVEELDREGQRLLQCIRCSDGFSGRNCIPGSADFQSLVPKITSLLDKLHSTRQHLHQMWHVRKLKLDQCFQLRLFEQDAEKYMFKASFLTWKRSGKELARIPDLLRITVFGSLRTSPSLSALPPDIAGDKFYHLPRAAYALPYFLLPRWTKGSCAVSP
ncbi:hypothetical protein ACRRTK_018795 [Alexandromys fortis]